VPPSGSVTPPLLELLPPPELPFEPPPFVPPPPLLEPL
jgi:hypothetical protein